MAKCIKSTYCWARLDAPPRRGKLSRQPRGKIGDYVAAAHFTGPEADPHLSRAGLRNLALDDLEICSRLRKLRRFHCRYCEFCNCRNSSFEFSKMVLENTW